MRTLISTAVLLALSVPAVAQTTATLALLETTDLHANVVGYDYYKLAPDMSLGLDRTATLIAQARREFPNTLLFDNGDTIQGTALADYQALSQPVRCDQVLGIYKVMNQLQYDGGGIGNHEFNYGLSYLGQVTGSRFDVTGVPKRKTPCAGPTFPQVLANIYSLKTHQPLFAPYRIITKQINARDVAGKPVVKTIKVGIIGFTPPTILAWDKRNLEGKVYAEGLRETAQKYIPKMKSEGADIIVAISHGGLDDSPYAPSMENGNWYLAQVPGIDAMLLGHSHQKFPDATSTVAQFNLPGVDKVRGTVHGVPTVMANLWGKHLGVIGLHLRQDGQRWIVDKEQTTVEARGIQQADKSFVPADANVLATIAQEHAATIAYVKTPVGQTDFRLSSYFSDVGDSAALEVVNQAQTAYAARYIKANLPKLAALPLLSMTAAFKSGFAGPADYTDVAPGSLALNNAADLYLYPNALYLVKITGAELKGWLETSGKRFNTIDPTLTTAQELINPGHPSFNFDTVTTKDFSYRIDVTKPVGQRIVAMTWRGQAVDPAQSFIVATNNYRASGGGNFPGLDGSKTVFAAPDNNRDVLIDYVRTTKTLTRAANGMARSWQFAPVKTAGPVVFHSAPGKLALAREAGIDNVSEVQADDGKGFAVYAVDLSK
ncbi:MAG: bifunctional 2',3'-cyclic-nucleotide 2'-phosphodiesterase/3'-nucleotidase [Pseudomonadota bacterium]|nr:bifunctional 2',3'-cyclic-nucleotide 2'-phosphodiesterase/3'-nucleotidase [Pseudomonadota bacterium]